MKKSRISKKVKALVLMMFLSISGNVMADENKISALEIYLSNLDENIKTNIVEILLRNASEKDLDFLKFIENKQDLSEKEEFRIIDIINLENEIKRKGSPFYDGKE